MSAGCSSGGCSGAEQQQQQSRPSLALNCRLVDTTDCAKRDERTGVGWLAGLLRWLVCSFVRSFALLARMVGRSIFEGERTLLLLPRASQLTQRQTHSHGERGLTPSRSSRAVQSRAAVPLLRPTISSSSRGRKKPFPLKSPRLARRCRPVEDATEMTMATIPSLLNSTANTYNNYCRRLAHDGPSTPANGCESGLPE